MADNQDKVKVLFDPITGKMRKQAGEEGLSADIKAGQKLGYQPTVRGKTVYMFKRNDPRLRAGSVSAPRQRDLSGILGTPRKKK